MKQKFILFSLLLCAFVSNGQTRYLQGVLQASQQVPSNPSAATGVVIIKYNTVSKTVEAYGNYTGLTTAITATHIHTGAAGTNGAVLVTLNHTGGTTGTISGSGTFTPAQEVDLLAGNMYLNVHTSTYPGGEIRAQLTATTNGQTDLFNARIQSSQQVPPTPSAATGWANILLDKATHNVYVTGSYTGLTTAANNAHIHVGAPGVSGGVIIPITFTAATSGTLHTVSTINTTNEPLMIAGNTYVNIHTSTYPSGEIRGQVNMLSQLRFFKGNLQGSQEVPPVTSAARGTTILKYNTENKLLSVIGDYQNLSSAITATHIHSPAPVGSTAPVLITLNHTGGTSGVISGFATLTAPQEADLFAGLMYVNVHNSTYPNGEVRAQLSATTDGQTQYLTGSLTSSQQNPPVTSPGTGTADVLLDRATNEVYVTGSFSGLTSNINNTHIHAGPTGLNGSVVIPLFFGGTTSGTITGNAVVRSTFADSMINGLSYLNIHTVNFGGGEIRAQLGNLVLPVKLTFFTGSKVGNKVSLVWESAQEQSLSNYDIEQQNENGEWLNKASLTAKNNITATRYQYNDLPFATKNSYVVYRLKMFDKDGKYSYSPTIRINYLKSKAELMILTNPVRQTSLQYTVTGLTTNRRLEVSIIDYSGRLQYKTTSSSLSNNTIPVSQLPSGMYKLVVKVDDIVLQQSFTK